MDPVQTVGGGAGLKKIADALRTENFVIDAIYLIRLVRDNDDVDWVIRLATHERSREVLVKTFELRRDGKIPRFGDQVRVDTILPEDPEARRVIAQAQRYGYAPVEFEGVLLDGMLIDYALVADFPGAESAAA